MCIFFHSGWGASCRDSKRNGPLLCTVLVGLLNQKMSFKILNEQCQTWKYISSSGIQQPDSSSFWRTKLEVSINIPFSDWGIHTEECRVEFHHEFMMFCFAYPLAVSESHKYEYMLQWSIKDKRAGEDEENDKWRMPLWK